MRKGLAIVLAILLVFIGLISFDGYRIQRTLVGQSEASPILAGKPANESSDALTEATEWSATQPFEQKTFEKDELVHRADYLPAKETTNKSVILVPDDEQTTPDGIAPLVQLYHEQFGYNVLVVERRGQIGKKNYGWLDRLDLIEWTKRLLEETGEEGQIVYHGLGIGGATALLAAGEDMLPVQVKVVVAEGAYARLDDWLNSLAEQQIGYPAGPSLAMASTFNKFEQDFFYGDVSVTRQTSKIMIPALFIHGTDDQFIPSRMVYELYQAKPGLKQLYPVRGADHNQTYLQDTVNYQKRLKLFIQPFMASN
ncbi:alpha/beta hydrolase [Exiguobacterium sp. s193]|uniref:alpha/beta hydrolase n=1 Tax=Exiguobacterium sp. s193 TaxID=2751207 RepID=UPI001BEAEB79